MLDAIFFVVGLALMAVIPALVVHVWTTIENRQRAKEEYKSKVVKNDEKINHIEINDLVNSVNERNKRINGEGRKED